MSETDGRPPGCLDQGEWDAFSAWMSDSGVLEEPVPAGDALTNDLLPEAC
jgi:hypothetical protein